MSGDTSTPAETKSELDPNVLSQKQEDKGQISKESEIAARNRENATRRLQHKSWKQKVESATLDPEASKLAVQRAAEKHGFDTKDEKNAAQVNMLADALQETQTLRVANDKKLRVEASTEALSQTLTDLGYDPKSDAFRYAGELLFKRFGVSDPDVFSDSERMGKEIEDLSSIIKPKRSSDPVKEEMIKKAAAIPPTTESRSEGRGPNAEVKAYAKEHGVSEERAQKLKDLQSKLPAYARR